MNISQAASKMSIYPTQDVQEVQPKKMNFIDRWFSKKAKEAWDNTVLESRRGPVSPVNSNSFNLAAEGLNVTIYGATGGQIVEFRRYDNKRDRNESKVYVIPTEQNFVESFSKIVSMEMMR